MILLRGGILPESSTSVSSSTFASVMTAITDQIDVSAVVEILAYAAGAAVGLVFLWWAVRKVMRVLMASFRSGRLSL